MARHVPSRVSVRRDVHSLDDLLRLSDAQFASALKQLLELDGWRFQKPLGTDLLFTVTDQETRRKVLVRPRRVGLRHTTNRGEVESLVLAMRDAGVDHGALVTTGRETKPAADVAQSASVTILHGAKLRYRLGRLDRGAEAIKPRPRPSSDEPSAVLKRVLERRRGVYACAACCDTGLVVNTRGRAGAPLHWCEAKACAARTRLRDHVVDVTQPR